MVDPAWFAMAGLALAIGGVVFRSGQLANSVESLRRELALRERAQEHKNEHFETEIEKLRDWRHHKVGESPGLAALVKGEELERRVDRLERKVFNGQKER